MEKPGSETLEIRRQVRKALAGAPAFAKLEPARREQLADSLEGHIASATLDRAGVTDFRAFVASLIEGTFNAIVDSTIEQMEAYADLLAEATKSVDEFIAGIDDEDEARERQRLLATMVLMGVNRVVFVEGAVRVRTVFALDDDDDDD